ncbi:MAG TPA: DUF1761 domain-containing protein [Allosphingosinicella sp.]|nr:DUF1761 domain-containing protein [Allosphingosinicella sp.]
MPEVNYLAVGLAALSAFLLGGLWYSALFARPWMAATGQSEEQLKSGNPAAVFGGAFLLNLVAAYVFAVVFDGITDIKTGALYGVAAGVGWVATALGVTYLFERRPLSLWLINGGYQVLQFTLFGVIIAAMG